VKAPAKHKIPVAIKAEPKNRVFPPNQEAEDTTRYFAPPLEEVSKLFTILNAKDEFALTVPLIFPYNFKTFGNAATRNHT